MHHRRVSPKNLDTLFVVFEEILIEIDRCVQSVYLTMRSSMLMSEGIRLIFDVEKAKKKQRVTLTSENLQCSYFYAEKSIVIRGTPSAKILSEHAVRR